MAEPQQAKPKDYSVNGADAAKSGDKGRDGVKIVCHSLQPDRHIWSGQFRLAMSSCPGESCMLMGYIDAWWIGNRSTHGRITS